MPSTLQVPALLHPERPCRGRIIDFFCGAGGSTIGAEWAGFRPVAAVNHWLIAARTYERNHGVSPLRCSIQTVAPNDLPPADILLFAPECKSHSDARGARERDEVSRATALEVVRFVAALRPRLFVCENVGKIRRWPLFNQWIADLEDLGYGLNRDREGRPGQVLNSADFGVPQSRKHWYLVGGRGYIPHVQSPRLSHRAVGECIDWSVSMRSITRRKRPMVPKSLARIEDGRRQFGDAPFLVAYYSSSYQEGGNAFPLDRPCRTVPCHDRFALVDGDRFRFLTPAELLRIMGFPETYELEGNRAQKIEQLGNAVTPPVMQSILEQVA